MTINLHANRIARPICSQLLARTTVSGGRKFLSFNPLITSMTSGISEKRLDLAKLVFNTFNKPLRPILASETREKLLAMSKADKKPAVLQDAVKVKFHANFLSAVGAKHVRKPSFTPKLETISQVDESLQLLPALMSDEKIQEAARKSQEAIQKIRAERDNAIKSKKISLVDNPQQKQIVQDNPLFSLFQ